MENLHPVFAPIVAGWISAVTPVARVSKDADASEFGPEEWHEERLDYTEERCVHCVREFYTDRLVATRVDGETLSLCFKCILDYEEGGR
jgi:hypothetical protein